MREREARERICSKMEKRETMETMETRETMEGNRFDWKGERTE